MTRPEQGTGEDLDTLRPILCLSPPPPPLQSIHVTQPPARRHASSAAGSFQRVPSRGVCCASWGRQLCSVRMRSIVSVRVPDRFLSQMSDAPGDEGAKQHAADGGSLQGKLSAPNITLNFLEGLSLDVDVATRLKSIL